MISHRMSLVEDSDYIINFPNGAVVKKRRLNRLGATRYLTKNKEFVINFFFDNYVENSFEGDGQAVFKFGHFNYNYNRHFPEVIKKNSESAKVLKC